MPLSSKITSNLSGAGADLRALGKQERFAHVLAMTWTARDGKVAEVAEIDRAIDRPTEYTRRAVYSVAATSARPEAEFGLKSQLTYAAPGRQPTNYLAPNIDGGQRNLKGMEKLLTLSGAMPSGWRVVPGQGARMDAFGNVSRGQIIQVLSQLRLTLTAGYNRNLARPALQFQRTRAELAAMTPQQRSARADQEARNAAYRAALRRAGGRFFVIKPGQGNRQPGIYQREFFGRNVTPVFIFVQRTSYRRVLDWQAVADRTVAERYDINLESARARARATARS